MVNGVEKVTVILATYNRKQFLKTALNSILKQSYPVHEIIVVDDHSDYDIISFLKEYEKKITIIINSSRKGSAYTYNKGIRQSHSEYITILNDDDIFHPTKIEKQLTILQQNTNLGLVYCPIGSFYNNNILYEPITKQKNRWIGLRHLNNIGITPLIKKECFDRCGLFDTDLSYNEDRDLWYRIGKQYAFGFHPDPLYIEYNHNIPRLSSSLKDICDGRIALYRKHAHDFDLKSEYYSNLFFELAQEHQLFGDYTNYLSYLIKSLQYKPSQLIEYLQVPIEKVIAKKYYSSDESIIKLLNNGGKLY